MEYKSTDTFIFSEKTSPHEIDHDQYTSSIFGTIIQKVMFDNYFSRGIQTAPVGFQDRFEEHFKKHLFFLTFDFKLDEFKCGPRLAAFIVAGVYYDLLLEKVMGIIECDPVAIQTISPDQDMTPYGIVFGQDKPMNFAIQKFWNRGAFDMTLLIHPDMLPYFERYIAKFNKSGNGIAFEFTDGAPFRSLKLVRYNPDDGNLHDVIEKRVSMMETTDLGPLFEESYTFLQELPSRAHMDTNFYIWQNELHDRFDQPDDLHNGPGTIH